jgi:hypothetical protein
VITPSGSGVVVLRVFTSSWGLTPGWSDASHATSVAVNTSLVLDPPATGYALGVTVTDVTAAETALVLDGGPISGWWALSFWVQTPLTSSATGIAMRVGLSTCDTPDAALAQCVTASLDVDADTLQGTGRSVPSDPTAPPPPPTPSTTRRHVLGSAAEGPWAHIVVPLVKMRLSGSGATSQAVSAMTWTALWFQPLLPAGNRSDSSATSAAFNVTLLDLLSDQAPLSAIKSADTPQLLASGIAAAAAVLAAASTDAAGGPSSGNASSGGTTSTTTPGSSVPATGAPLSTTSGTLPTPSGPATLDAQSRVALAIGVAVFVLVAMCLVVCAVLTLRPYQLASLARRTHETVAQLQTAEPDGAAKVPSQQRIASRGSPRKPLPVVAPASFEDDATGLDVINIHSPHWHQAPMHADGDGAQPNDLEMPAPLVRRSFSAPGGKHVEAEEDAVLHGGVHDGAHEHQAYTAPPGQHDDEAHGSAGDVPVPLVASLSDLGGPVAAAALPMPSEAQLGSPRPGGLVSSPSAQADPRRLVAAWMRPAPSAERLPPSVSQLGFPSGSLAGSQSQASLAVSPSGTLPRRLTRSAGGGVVRVQDVDKLEVIGRGGEGNVWKALWQGNVVALKEWHLTLSAEHLAAIRGEVELLRQLRHPHVVEFFGACTEPPFLCLIMEFAVGGTLAQLIHGTSTDALPPRLPLLRVIQLSEDIASALDYLHAARIVHRDVKPSNVLLNAAGRAALTDFGISKHMPGTQLLTQNCNAGTLAYMAPELFIGDAVCEKVDVYAFAVVLWEMLAQQQPLREYGGNHFAIMHAVCQGERPAPMPRHVPRRMQALIHDMWTQEPGQRPALLDVRHRLAVLRKDEAKTLLR